MKKIGKRFVFLVASLMAIYWMSFSLNFAAETQPTSKPATNTPTTKPAVSHFASIEPFAKELRSLSLLDDDKWLDNEEARQKLRTAFIHFRPILDYYIKGVVEDKFKPPANSINEIDSGPYGAIVGNLVRINYCEFLYHKALGQYSDCIDRHIDSLILCKLPLVEKFFLMYWQSAFYGGRAVSRLVEDVGVNYHYSRDHLQHLLSGMIKYEPMTDLIDEVIRMDWILSKQYLATTESYELNWKTMIEMGKAEKKDMVDIETTLKQYDAYYEEVRKWVKLGFLQAQIKGRPDPGKNPYNFFLYGDLATWQAYRQFMENYYLAEYLVAAKLFYMEEGKLPESLADLDKKYFGGKGKPDMFSEKPLNFAKGENSIKIWSVGPDMKDDGGKEMAQDRTGDLVVEFKPQ